ncbi:MAG: helix-turn-helix domain-containing protein [Deltaproteobacteria bacterium]|nr:helix-turn-helix domain-containing protein [Deltaproteobacteria bacterium]
MNLVSIKELSEFLKVKPSTLYSWVHNGTIPFIKLNGLLRFDMDEITKWIENSKPPKPPASFKKATNLDIDSIVKRAVASLRKGSYDPSTPAFGRRGKRETSPESRPRKGGADGTV